MTTVDRCTCEELVLLNAPVDDTIHAAVVITRLVRVGFAQGRRCPLLCGLAWSQQVRIRLSMNQGAIDTQRLSRLEPGWLTSPVPILRTRISDNTFYAERHVRNEQGETLITPFAARMSVRIKRRPRSSSRSKSPSICAKPAMSAIRSAVLFGPHSVVSV